MSNGPRPPEETGATAPDPARREARALELFTASLELPEERREAWLDEACAGDATLREELRRLAEADAGATPGFLDSPAAAAAPDLAGERLGAFELLEEIGAGGMGRVFRARRADGAFEQEVAVKLFEARLTSPDARERFHAERQILASLEHPGIARLIDGGSTPRGTPYVVMELVRGQRITEYCAGAALDLPARLRLFQQVCAAVQAAHDRGVIHRDLKPGNILVDEHAQPRLIDFGIAKVLAPGVLEAARAETRTQARVLTPEYASPEQVRGEAVGVASDVYSLGVLLYELLTGTRPYRFDSLSPAAIERTVCESMPSNPSELLQRRRLPSPAGLDELRALRRLLRGDLDRIVMTALRKEPEARYGSAAALAEDIERYLTGHPVLARGASRAYRLRRFIQRNRAASVAAATVLLVLLASLVVVTRQAAEAERQRDLARQEAARATAAKDFLVELIGRSDPFETAASPTLAGALKQSLPGVGERFAGQPALEAEMRYAIGYALQNLGEIAPARAQLERALALRREHGDAVDQAEALDGMGVVAWWESDFEAGETYFREALDLLAEAPGARAGRVRLNALTNLAGMLADAGDYPRSAATSEEALAAAAGLPELPAENRAMIWGNLANALGSMEGRLADSLAAFDRTLALQREATGELHPNYAIVLNNLALTHYALGDLDSALPLLERSLEIRRATLGREHPQTATALFNLAGGQVAAGRYREAEPNALAALEVAKGGYAAGHPRIGKAHEKLAQVYEATGRPALAREHAEAALAIYQGAAGVDPAWIATVEAILAELEEARPSG